MIGRYWRKVGNTPEALRELSLSPSNMGDISEALGRLEEAEDAYRQSLEIDRKVLKRFGESPEALRDLSVSLSNMGDISTSPRPSGGGGRRVPGESDNKAQAIGEIWRDSRAAPRDLSVSLNRMGDISRALGRLEDAEGAYRESLEIDRKVLEKVGNTPEALRDLSISLEIKWVIFHEPLAVWRMRKGRTVRV